MARNIPPRATGISDYTVDKTKPPIYATSTDVPFITKCSECKNTVSTEVQFEVGAFAWVACIMIASFGFIFGCCAVPFCVKGTKDIVHICPDCGYEIGRNCRL